MDQRVQSLMFMMMMMMMMMMMTVVTSVQFSFFASLRLIQEIWPIHGMCLTFCLNMRQPQHL